MNSHRSTKAEATAAILQTAAGRGLPVQIPGALEARVRSVSRPAAVTAEMATPAVHTAAAGDRERLEHEREGGGAPSERTGLRQRALLWRLGKLLSNSPS